MSNLKTALTGIIIGTTIGYAVNKIKQPEYTLQETNKQTYVITTKPRQEYQIYETQNKFYLGTLEHNLDGVKNIAYKHGLKIYKDQYEELQKQNKELETKIKRRRIFDKIEETRDKIKYWYQDTKRKQLE